MLRKLRKKIATFLFPPKGRGAKWSKTLEAQREYRSLLEPRRASHPGLPMNSGYKVYSQADEDGIIDYILKKMNVIAPTFFECGCGEGIENNTHYLALKGGRGVWMDGSTNNIRDIEDALGGLRFEKRLLVTQGLLTVDTVTEHFEHACSFLDVEQLDVFSLDVDSLEFYVLKKLMSSRHRPRLIVVEYNAKFPPDLSIKQAETDEGWDTDDYMGASLACLNDVLSEDYLLVSCSAPGTNAFFVLREYADKFENYSIFDVYQPLALWLADIQPGHRPTLKYLRDMLAKA